MKSTPSDAGETKVSKSKDTATAKAGKAVKASPAKAGPAKSTANKIAAGKAPSAKETAQAVKSSRPASAKKPAKAQSAGIVSQLVFDLQAMIEIEAYLRAEQRGFAPGRELDDWLEAERDVLNRLGQSGTQSIPQ